MSTFQYQNYHLQCSVKFSLHRLTSTTETTGQFQLSWDFVFSTKNFDISISDIFRYKSIPKMNSCQVSGTPVKNSYKYCSWKPQVMMRKHVTELPPLLCQSYCQRENDWVLRSIHIPFHNFHPWFLKINFNIKCKRKNTAMLFAQYCSDLILTSFFRLRYINKILKKRVFFYNFIVYFLNWYWISNLALTAASIWCEGEGLKLGPVGH